MNSWHKFYAKCYKNVIDSMLYKMHDHIVGFYNFSAVYKKKIKIYFYGNVFKTKHHQKKQKTKYNIEN